MYKRGTKQWNWQHKSILVGICNTTHRVKRVHERNDGVLTDGTGTHFPLHGIKAETEAHHVFGMTNVRAFSIHQEASANAYADDLQKHLDAAT